MSKTEVIVDEFFISQTFQTQEMRSGVANAKRYRKDEARITASAEDYSKTLKTKNVL